MANKKKPQARQPKEPNPITAPPSREQLNLHLLNEVLQHMSDAQTNLNQAMKSGGVQEVTATSNIALAQAILGLTKLVYIMVAEDQDKKRR